MAHAVVFDCEFLTAEGSPSRFWCGPLDPDPTVVQIGLVRIDLEADFPITDRRRLHVTPRDREGNRPALDPVFTKLTGVTEQVIDNEGLPLREALVETARFASGARLWSWGKDEFNLVAISCYVEGFPPPLPATRFGNACRLLLKSGMPYEDIARMRSDRLSAYFKLEHPPLRPHDALDDALSVALVLRHLLQRGSLDPADLA